MDKLKQGGKNEVGHAGLGDRSADVFLNGIFTGTSGPNVLLEHTFWEPILSDFCDASVKKVRQQQMIGKLLQAKKRALGIRCYTC